MSKQRSETLSDTQAELRRERAAMWKSFNDQVKEQPILYGVIFVLIGLLVGGLLFHYEPEWEANNLFSFLTNFATEALGVLVTVAVVNAWQDRRAQERLKRELLADIKYGTNADARRAIRRAHEWRWLEKNESILAGKDLRRAELQESTFRCVNLHKADLRNADLSNARFDRGSDLSKIQASSAIFASAILHEINLQNAQLFAADLSSTGLRGTDLKGAYLAFADLSKSNLSSADLRYTVLMGANLRNADLWNAQLSEDTVLPDAERTEMHFGRQMADREFTSYYDPAKGPKQLERFTNPDHPEFWDPCKELKGGNRPGYCKEDNTNAS